MVNFRFYALTLLFCAAFFVLFSVLGGWPRFEGYIMDYSYPPLVPALNAILSGLVSEPISLLLLLLFFAVMAPALVIEHYWGWEMGIGYLFAAGGMMMLVDNTAIAQSAGQLLMLLSLGNPVFYALFGAIGQYTHREWIGGIVMTFVFDLARRDYGLVKLI